MRTDISEDPKGDPSKSIPTKPPVEPDDPAEPLLPQQDLDAAPSKTSGDPQEQHKTPGDRQVGHHSVSAQ